ncbi:chemotaxis protein CheW [Saltatorellus ferox]
MSEDELRRAARQGAAEHARSTADCKDPIEYLVASVGGDRRVAMELSQVDRLEEVESATVEKAGTLRFIQYRGELLQLIDVGQAMGAASSTDPDRRVWKTIVRSNGGTSYGLVVDDVLDIIEVSANEKPHPSPDSAIASVLVVGGRVTEVIDEVWLAASFGALGGPELHADGTPTNRGQAPPEESLQVAPEVTQLCTFRLGKTLYGIDVLDVQEVLMPLQRTPIPLSPPEVEGLLNLRGDTVLSVDLGVLLGIPEAERMARARSARTSLGKGAEVPDRMNVVLRSSQGSFSMLVDEVGEVLDLPRALFEPCPSTISSVQRRVASGVFKLQSDILIQLDVDQLHALVAQSQALARV